MGIQRTFCMVKPDAVHRRLVGEIISRIENKGLQIVGLKMIQMPSEKATELYKVHEGRPFHGKLMSFITSSPVVVMAIEGYESIATMRKLLGATFGFEAEPGTIRGDFAMSRGKNAVHGSDSEENAKRELGIFFSDAELVENKPVDLDWVYEPDERG